jgi:hypothetical protein
MLLTEDRSPSPSWKPSTDLAIMHLTHKRASVNGVNLHYVTAGSGAAVLYLHHRTTASFVLATFSNS